MNFSKDLEEYNEKVKYYFKLSNGKAYNGNTNVKFVGKNNKIYFTGKTYTKYSEPLEHITKGFFKTEEHWKSPFKDWASPVTEDEFVLDPIYSSQTQNDEYKRNILGYSLAKIDGETRKRSVLETQLKDNKVRNLIDKVKALSSPDQVSIPNTPFFPAVQTPVQTPPSGSSQRNLYDIIPNIFSCNISPNILGPLLSLLANLDDTTELILPAQASSGSPPASSQTPARSCPLTRSASVGTRRTDEPRSPETPAPICPVPLADQGSSSQQTAETTPYPEQKRQGLVATVYINDSHQPPAAMRQTASQRVLLYINNNEAAIIAYAKTLPNMGSQQATANLICKEFNLSANSILKYAKSNPAIIGRKPLQ
jgi:hypothetical protein